MIGTGKKEPVNLLVLDTSGAALSGKTDIKISIRRTSDDKGYDWSNDTFATTPTTPKQVLTEVGTTGEYKLNTANHVNGFDTSKITNATANDAYIVKVFQDGGQDAANLPVTAELKVGHHVDDITLVLGLVQNNFFLDSTTYNSAGLLTAGRIRIFATKTLADAATDGGSGEGELAAFAITATAESSPFDALPKTYKVTKSP